MMRKVYLTCKTQRLAHWHSHSDDLRDTVNDLEAPNIEVEEGPEVTSAKLEETKSNEKDIKNCFEFENFETPDSIDFSGDSIEKTKVKMVSDSKSVANTDEQAGQALQLTIVLIYLNNNTRGKMIKNLNARMGEICSLSREPILKPGSLGRSSIATRKTAPTVT